jgi:hypothetical protein
VELRKDLRTSDGHKACQIRSSEIVLYELCAHGSTSTRSGVNSDYQLSRYKMIGKPSVTMYPSPKTTIRLTSNSTLNFSVIMVGQVKSRGKI